MGSAAPFGCGSCPMQNRSMRTSSSYHVSFAQRPIEDKVLFDIQSMSAWEYHCNWPHTAAEVYHDLERIWTAAELSPEDLRDWRRMSELLKTQLSKCIPQEWSRIEPKTKARRWPLQ